MPTPTFQRVTLAQFQQLLEQFPFTRQIDAVHMHHTWRPRRADFRGHDTILAMWRHHTQTNGWRDIAQHITIDPEGFIWLGRNWNAAPASARQPHNGNSAVGPFMFEMVGDFDVGRDPFDGPQKDTVLRVIAAVQRRFQLAPQSLRFHNTMSSKTCPGSGIDYATVLAELAELQVLQPAAAQAAPAGGARRRGTAAQAVDAEIDQALRALTREPPPGDEPADAQVEHGEHDAHDHGAGPAGGTRGSGLSAADLAGLRPHLISLTAGRLSTTGEAKTSVQDVDTIFEQHLPQALAAAGGRPLKLLFYAHGGLVSESRGLQLAQRHVAWWLRNGVYPVYFVWETGIFQILGELLGLARRGRAVELPGVFDPAIEAIARAGGGVSIWGGMKANAQRAADAPTATNPVGGGAHYTAMKLQAFCAAHPGQVELYAVGHSAGAIFHAHFLPLARRLGVPGFRSAQFLAPAVRVDTFKDQLLTEIAPGGAVESLTVFTMQKDFERQDHCARIYRKSLLYLIHHALEEEDKTPLLGLEESLRADPALKQLFGLGGTPTPRAAVVWSPSAGSQAKAHGDFDDDAPTMDSVLRSILDAAPREPYPSTRSTSTADLNWTDEVDWPDAAREAMGRPPAAPSTPATPPAPAPQPAGTGRRTAVCVGIDAYPDDGDRLGGCVNDARRWAQALAAMGFQTRLLLDGDATRQAIHQHLQSLVDESRAGDVIVFQYAGHGTYLDDLDGDEDDARDEAMCPVDFRTGALYIDDDIAKVLARVPNGVNLTLFMDCCHSGTISRVAVGNTPRPPGTKARFVRPTPALQEAHRQFRAQQPATRGAVGGTGGRNNMRDVRFSACQDHQVALESNGSGEFTLRALRVLEGGIGGLTNDAFQQRVVQAFGPRPAQDPKLDCAEGGGARALLQPLVAAADAQADAPADTAKSGAPRKTPPGASAAADPRVLQAVHLLSQAISTLTAPPAPGG